ncbi:MAG: DegV family protein [Coriobacteriia bacterium]|nr:DegV family protein [Coriobacteriia bacterium]
MREKQTGIEGPSAGGVAIVTDSTADLTREVCRRYGIRVVPLTLNIGDESIPDGTLSQAEFMRRMGAMERLPTTSQPSVGAFIDAYRSALETASHVVSVNISSKLSGTYSSARRAAEDLQGKVHVVDSKNLSWGLGLQVVEAAKAAVSGASVSDVVKRAEYARDRVQMLVGLDSMDNLVKGGRINRIAGTVGGMLNVRITITPKDGLLTVVRPVRGARKALEFTVKWLEERLNGARAGAFCVMHALSEDKAAWLKDAIEQHFEPTELYVVETGSVIATHTGTGWGVAVLPEE